jgi:hypothetical protein
MPPQLLHDILLIIKRKQGEGLKGKTKLNTTPLAFIGF